MQRVPLSSESIASAGYEADSHTLEIEFTSGGVYRYYAVPRSVYEELTAADSHGRYFAYAIRDRYRYVKLR